MDAAAISVKDGQLLLGYVPDSCRSRLPMEQEQPSGKMLITKVSNTNVTNVERRKNAKYLTFFGRK